MDWKCIHSASPQANGRGRQMQIYMARVRWSETNHYWPHISLLRQIIAIPNQRLSNIGKVAMSNSNPIAIISETKEISMIR